MKNCVINKLKSILPREKKVKKKKTTKKEPPPATTASTHPTHAYIHTSEIESE